jgi:hypothetical protein
MSECYSHHIFKARFFPDGLPLKLNSLFSKLTFKSKKHYLSLE